MPLNMNSTRHETVVFSCAVEGCSFQTKGTREAEHHFGERHAAGAMVWVGGIQFIQFEREDYFKAWHHAQYMSGTWTGPGWYARTGDGDCGSPQAESSHSILRRWCRDLGGKSEEIRALQKLMGLPHTSINDVIAVLEEECDDWRHIDSARQALEAALERIRALSWKDQHED